MTENNYLCHECGTIFRLTGCIIGEIICPHCGGNDTMTLPSWSPLGSNLSESTLEWEYECQHCSRRFSLPRPSSPSQEKDIRCPYCEHSHIHRLTGSGYEPLYCG